LHAGWISGCWSAASLENNNWNCIWFCWFAICNPVDCLFQFCA
jgi:hypothetical protein